MDKKNLIIIFSSFLLLLIIFGVSYAYFSAQITNDESGTTITLDSGDLTITFDGGPTISASNLYPKDTVAATKTFTVTGTNETNLTMPYILTLVVDTNEFTNNAITYNLTGVNTSNNGELVPDITGASLSNGQGSYIMGTGSFSNGVDNVHTYKLELYYLDNGTDQSADKGAAFAAHIEISADNAYLSGNTWNNPQTGTLLYALKNNNTVTSPLTTPGLTANLESEAVLASSTDDYGTTYYFRGAVENNYVVFANMCWRIVRVTGNGAIKLALASYNPDSLSNPCEDTGTSSAFIKVDGGWLYYAIFNSEAADATYAGLMYGDTTTFTINSTMETSQFQLYNYTYYYGSSYTYDSANNVFTLSGNLVSTDWTTSYSDILSTYPYTCLSDSSTGTCSVIFKVDEYLSQYDAMIYRIAYTSTSYAQAHANVNKSDALQYLETWYNKNLKSYSSYLADTIWCNDLSLTDGLGYGINSSTFSGYTRLANGTPSFICPDDSSGGSLSRYTVSDTTNGNGDLDYPIGLLTADEVAYAGGGESISTSTYYLYRNASQAYTRMWTLTPTFGGDEYWRYAIYTDTTASRLDSRFSPNDGNGVIRPSIALVSGVVVTGSGTNSDPYIVQ